ncbi:MAG: GNAT family N-acetyltransferase [Pedobacter sp.]|nr:MAG: GNAT family N-acetyltransferase [Pedobacter sp.]
MPIRKTVSPFHFILRNAELPDAPQMEYIQSRCYPTLSQEEIIKKHHFENHIKLFPQGQFVIEDKNKMLIATTSTFLCHFPIYDHTFLEATDQLWLTKSHQKDGQWLYGVDMGVLPEYRGKGLSKELYKARQEMCQILGIKGQVTVGMPIGYGQYQNQLSITAYCEKLKNNELSDPTISAQRKAGFIWIKPIFNYLRDPEAGNAGILMYFPLADQFKIDFNNGHTHAESN